VAGTVVVGTVGCRRGDDDNDDDNESTDSQSEEGTTW
jgi:hypothetical protein